MGSEAKQLPRLTIAGPTMGTRNKRGIMNYPIGNVVPAIIPTYFPKNFQRPGDVYRPLSKSSSRHTPRPLGLIPEREDYTNELPSRFSRTLFSQPSKFKQQENDNNSNKPTTAIPATRLKPINVQYRAKSAMTFGDDNVQSNSTNNPSILYEETDPDYMDILNVPSTPSYPLDLPHNSPEHTPNIHIRNDNSYLHYQKHRHSVSLPVKPNKLKKPRTGFRNRAHSLRPHLEAADSTIERYKYQQQQHSQHGTQYITFVGQASLNHRHFGMDKRDGLDYIPCERCRLRGGRCSNCKTIRIGGGYIILDGDADDESMRRGNGGLDNGDSQSMVNRLPTLTDDNNQVRRNRGLCTNNSLQDINEDGDDDDGNEGKGNNSYSNNIWGHGTSNHHGSNTDNMAAMMHNGSKIALSQNSKTNLAVNRSSSSGLDNSGSNMGRRSDVGLSQTGIGGDMDTSGLDQVQSSHSRPGSSRPVSSRPKSSRNRVGSGVGNRQNFQGKNRKGGISTSMEKSRHGGRRKKKSGDDDSGDDDSSENDDDETRRRRKKKDGNSLPDIDEHDKTKKKKQAKNINLHGKYDGEDSEPEQGLNYTGSLYKFKSKEDNVKALKCTLKELHGIDPLDYLAKYCIIDQSKVPNYRRVYDNVDRDEDDEIDINELDFALKAVNYDLITDAEVDYVNQILELSSRYKLNFHLFSVIAALSEKVVALEDMVKKLINKMDLKALETKMKKCKELFYLLDDMDSGERGGVVTIASLAVELQAGGLTEEHVEFVVDRLNRDNKGLVEFLDYLTYVPLFVEIHDSVCGNPLDFTRTK